MNRINSCFVLGQLTSHAAHTHTHAPAHTNTQAFIRIYWRSGSAGGPVFHRHSSRETASTQMRRPVHILHLPDTRRTALGVWLITLGQNYECCGLLSVHTHDPCSVSSSNCLKMLTTTRVHVADCQRVSLSTRLGGWWILKHLCYTSID